MVAIRYSDHSQANTQIHEVVDGQQRLATFCLLLALIALAAKRLEDRARESKDERTANQLKVFAEEIMDEYLLYDRYDIDKGHKAKEARLTLSETDDAKFKALLQGRKLSDNRDSHRKLQAAYDLLEVELIKPMVSAPDTFPGKLSALRTLRDSLLEHAFVIHVVTEDHRGGYRLFSVLNDRGKRLAIADLLRSHTLELLDRHGDLQTKAAQRWDEIFIDGSKLADDFLHAYYPSLQGKRVGTERLFASLDDLLFSNFQGNALISSDVAARVDAMAEEFERFCQIRQGHWPYAEDASNVSEWQRARLRRLTVLLKHELAIPLLLAASSSADEAKFAELVHMLEKFAFRYKNVCGGHASAASSHYYRAAKEVRELADNRSSITWDSLSARLSKVITDRAPNSKFRSDLIDQARYGTSSQKANLKELLTTIDDYWVWLRSGAKGKPRHEQMMVVDLDKVTIEHIYPRNPQSAHRDSELDRRKDLLGNLAYWSPDDNVQAGNLPFHAKRRSYRESKSHMTRQLSDLPSWDVAQFDSRVSRILDDACIVFSL
jgi:hypothetical protein